MAQYNSMTSTFDYMPTVPRTTITLYHYTTREGLKGIIKDKKINQSLAGARDAVFGSGVYFTQLTPEFGTRQIAKNNFDGSNITNVVKAGKLGYFIEIVFSKLDPNLKNQTDDRSVWLYEDDVNLNNFTWKPGKKNPFQYIAI